MFLFLVVGLFNRVFFCVICFVFVCFVGVSGSGCWLFNIEVFEVILGIWESFL